MFCYAKARLEALALGIIYVSTWSWVLIQQVKAIFDNLWTCQINMNCTYMYLVSVSLYLNLWSPCEFIASHHSNWTISLCLNIFATSSTAKMRVTAMASCLGIVLLAGGCSSSSSIGYGCGRCEFFRHGLVAMVNTESFTVVDNIGSRKWCSECH